MLSKALVVGQYQKKAEELARHSDLELIVVVPPFWRDERGIVPLERAHTRGYTLLVEPMRFNGQFHLHYYPTLPKILRQIQPDLVHIDEEPYNLATFLARRAARRVGAKSLFFTWQNILRRYPPPFSWIESDVLRHSDYAIAGNADAVQVLRAKNYRGAVKVIPQFGVDPEFFHPITQSHNRPFCIGSGVGRLVEEKGVDVLLRAVAGLHGDWEIRLLGSGPAQTQLETLARELGIAARVHFDAPRLSVEMPEYYAQLDVLVMPSRTRSNWKEQFGRALIEAMASGVPVIGSDCGEIPNVIGDAGLIFREEDVDALRAHLVALQDNPRRRAELGQRGRARVLAHFTQARVAEETYAVYREITDKETR
ncbi:MAG: glycosyltransferase family 4 protein [Anaerolineales bacterium]|nr:glycosyltransferase family 4 protein [Anaerolineales bacterium]